MVKLDAEYLVSLLRSVPKGGCRRFPGAARLRARIWNTTCLNIFIQPQYGVEIFCAS